MLTSLIDLTSTGEFEDDGAISITSADHVGQDLVLGLSLFLPDGQIEKRAIQCRSPRCYRIGAAEREDSIAVLDDHVLLWPSVQFKVQLHFNGSATDSRPVLGALALQHYQLLGEWFPFPEFVNGELFRDLFRFGSGLLATGPQAVMEAYGDVLDEFGIGHSSPPGRPPSWWNGTSWQEERERLHLLLIGRSYVVAPEFSEITDMHLC
jgi:hypothetical protein